MSGTNAFAVHRRVLLACASMLMMPFPALADSFSNTNNCMSGLVGAADYAEYDADFKAGDWNNSSGVKISSASNPVTLRVTDANGNSICSNTANPETQCQFQAGFQSTFTIRIDNAQNYDPSTYKVCAY